VKMNFVIDTNEHFHTQWKWDVSFLCCGHDFHYLHVYTEWDKMQ
jgi:hypothetical protein